MIQSSSQQPDIKVVLGQMALMSVKTVMDDGMWQKFGFQKAVRRGTFFDRFVSKSKLQAEKFIARELILIPVVDSIQAIKLSGLDQHQKENYAMAVIAAPGEVITKMSIFDSLDSYKAAVLKALEEYSKVPHFFGHFRNKLNSEVEDEKAREPLLAGAFKVFADTSEDEKGILFDRAGLGSMLVSSPDIESARNELFSKINVKPEVVGLFAALAKEVVK